VLPVEDLPDPIAIALPITDPEKLTGPERAFWKILQLRLAAGEYVWIGEHPFSLRLADGLRWSPDFAAVTREGFILVFEVKGTGGWSSVTFNRGGRGGRGSEGGKSRAKFLMAVRCFPFYRFVAAFKRTKKQGGGFVETPYQARMPYQATASIGLPGQPPAASPDS
jgi:hypothetical protein